MNCIFWFSQGPGNWINPSKLFSVHKLHTCFSSNQALKNNGMDFMWRSRLLHATMDFLWGLRSQIQTAAGHPTSLVMRKMRFKNQQLPYACVENFDRILAGNLLTNPNLVTLASKFHFHLSIFLIDRSVQLISRTLRKWKAVQPASLLDKGTLPILEEKGENNQV